MGAPSPVDPAGDVARIIEERWSLVRRICNARLPASDVDDAVQDTFVQFLIANREGIRNIDAWLIVVALRTCMRIHSNRYRSSEVPFGNRADVSHDVSLDEVLDSEWFAQVCQSLPAADRSLLDWLYLNPRPRRDVAADLGVSPNHLRVLAFRARRRAQAVIEALDLLEPGA